MRRSSRVVQQPRQGTGSRPRHDSQSDSCAHSYYLQTLRVVQNSVCLFPLNMNLVTFRVTSSAHDRHVCASKSRKMDGY